MSKVQEAPVVRPLVVVLWISLLGAAGARSADAAPPAGKSDPKAAELAAWAAAQPVMQKYCALCHHQRGTMATKRKLGHFDMTSYPLGGHHAATIGATISKVLGLTGQRARMPFNKPGAVTGSELALVKAWIDAWQAADTAGAHGVAAAHS